jgi:hypothetical protein
MYEEITYLLSGLLNSYILLSLSYNFYIFPEAHHQTTGRKFWQNRILKIILLYLVVTVTIITTQTLFYLLTE